MVRNLLFLAVACFLLGGCISVHETKRVCEEEQYVEIEADAPAQVLRHVVRFLRPAHQDRYDL